MAAQAPPNIQFTIGPDSQHFSRFGDGPWAPILQHVDATGNRLAVAPSFNQVGGNTADANGGPILGSNNTIMFQSVPGPSVIDPALIDLPKDSADDFPPPHKLAAHFARPAAKTAGSRRSDLKGKGKQRTRDSETPVPRKAASSAISGVKRKRGG
ncbi:hypothetical protein BDZ89DRAFT_1130634 [Hymenopellis radicata]|nr:hypothetical protein BDZ89DRAFT_1130634 [Hymenopellis radicata]